MAILLVVFGNLIGRYRSNITYDSASHLIEINHQVRYSVEETVSGDRSFARSVADDVQSRSFADESELLAYLGRQKDIWGADSIRLYTSDGACYDQSGIALNRDAASRFAYQVIQGDGAYSIIDSKMEYGVPIEAGLTVNGQPVVVVSVVRDLDTLIDDMGLQSFDDQGYLYLTRQNGVTISQSTSEGVPVVFNVSSLFADRGLSCLSQDGLDITDAMETGTESVFLYTDSENVSRYIVMTPVQAMDETLYLFYTVPEAKVNMTMDGFIDYIAMLTAMVIVVFLLLLTVFFLVYRSRARRYASDVRGRERLLDLIVSETDTVFLLLSRKESKPQYVSSNAARILGTTNFRTEDEHGHIKLISEEQDENETLAHVNNALSVWDGEHESTSDYLPYGNKLDPHYMVLRLYPSRGQDDECIGIIHDVTAERLREDNLRNALVMADSANQAKTRFLSNMSHDIRTPMNAIINMTRFALDETDDPDKIQTHLHVIQDSSEHLLGLINDVLDMSRIESGEMSLTSEPFDLDDALSDACEIIRPLCLEKHQTFHTDWSGIRHRDVVGDQLRLGQIVINLLNNAMKFTPEGGHVSFIVDEPRSLLNDTVSLHLVISDDGIGMDENTLDHLFDPFTRGDDARVRQIEGSGLGLSTTRNLIEAMGGSISVESKPGNGSTFIVDLFFPIARGTTDVVDRVSQPDDDRYRFEGKHALLVEDNAINQTIASMILQKWGFIVDIASDGEEAVDMFISSADLLYDIVFMDVQMPVMDGYTAARLIRSSEKPDAKSIPIVAMTANVFTEDIERARQAGMDAHIGKPIDPAEVGRTAAELLQGDDEED